MNVNISHMLTEENVMVFLIDTETFDKIQYSLMIEILSKLKVEWNIFI